MKIAAVFPQVILITLLGFAGTAISQTSERMESCRRLIAHAAAAAPQLALHPTYSWQSPVTTYGDFTIHTNWVKSFYIPVTGGGVITSVIAHSPEDPKYFYGKRKSATSATGNTYFWATDGRDVEGVIAKLFTSRRMDDMELPLRLLQSRTPQEDLRNYIERSRSLPSYTLGPDQLDWLVVPTFNNTYVSGYEVFSSEPGRGFTIRRTDLNKYFDRTSKTQGILKVWDAKMLTGSHRLLILQEFESEDRKSTFFVVEYDLKLQKPVKTHPLNAKATQIIPHPQGLIVGNPPGQEQTSFDYFRAQGPNLLRRTFLSAEPFTTYAVGSDERAWVASGNQMRSIFPEGTSTKGFSTTVKALTEITQIFPPGPESSLLLVKGIKVHESKLDGVKNYPLHEEAKLVLQDLESGTSRSLSLGRMTNDGPKPLTAITQLGPEEWVVARWRLAKRAIPRPSDKDCDDLANASASLPDTDSPDKKFITKPSAQCWTQVHFWSVTASGFRTLTRKLVEFPIELHIAGFSRDGRVFFIGGDAEEKENTQPQFFRFRLSTDDDDDDGEESSSPTAPFQESLK